MERINKEVSETAYVRLRNRQPHSITLHIEPWGEQLMMAPDVIYVVAMNGPAGDCMEVSLEEKNLVVYGWAGSIFYVHQDGMVLCECSIPAPATPSELA